jgi:hypothetical protein
MAQLGDQKVFGDVIQGHLHFHHAARHQLLIEIYEIQKKVN